MFKNINNSISYINNLLRTVPGFLGNELNLSNLSNVSDWSLEIYRRKIALKYHPDKHLNEVSKYTEKYKAIEHHFDILNKYKHQNNYNPTTFQNTENKIRDISYIPPKDKKTAKDFIAFLENIKSQVTGVTISNISTKFRTKVDSTNSDYGYTVETKMSHRIKKGGYFYPTRWCDKKSLQNNFYDRESLSLDDMRKDFSWDIFTLELLEQCETIFSKTGYSIEIAIRYGCGTIDVSYENSDLSWESKTYKLKLNRGDSPTSFDRKTFLKNLKQEIKKHPIEEMVFRGVGSSDTKEVKNNIELASEITDEGISKVQDKYKKAYSDVQTILLIEHIENLIYNTLGKTSTEEYRHSLEDLLNALDNKILRLDTKAKNILHNQIEVFSDFKNHPYIKMLGSSVVSQNPTQSTIKKTNNNQGLIASTAKDDSKKQLSNNITSENKQSSAKILDVNSSGVSNKPRKILKSHNNIAVELNSNTNKKNDQLNQTWSEWFQERAWYNPVSIIGWILCKIGILEAKVDMNTTNIIENKHNINDLYNKFSKLEAQQINSRHNKLSNSEGMTYYNNQPNTTHFTADQKPLLNDNVEVNNMKKGVTGI